jgi:hypothetical protein
MPPHRLVASVTAPDILPEAENVTISFLPVFLVSFSRVNVPVTPIAEPEPFVPENMPVKLMAVPAR